MRPFVAFVVGSTCLVLGSLSGCSGSHRNRQQSAHTTTSTQVSSTTTTTTPSLSPLRGTESTSNSAAPAPPIVLTNSEPATPSTYSAAPPAKPRIAGLSEQELSRCESELPTLEQCKPNAADSAAIDELRACIARYVAAVDGCLCKAGSKAYCQFAEDQKRELAKINK